MKTTFRSLCPSRTSGENAPVGNLSDDIAGKFPGKLWGLVNSCETGAISWGDTGTTILIHTGKFTMEYLTSKNPTFITKNMNSFIRQLNLYGFRKIGNNVKLSTVGCNIDKIILLEFMNINFVKCRPDLLLQMKRNVCIKKVRELEALRKQLEQERRLTELVNTNRVMVENRNRPVSWSLFKKK